jgi:hypothetical protein
MLALLSGLGIKDIFYGVLITLAISWGGWTYHKYEAAVTYARDAKAETAQVQAAAQRRDTMRVFRLLSLLALLLLASCATTPPIVVPAACYQVPAPPPRESLQVPAALDQLSKALNNSSPQPPLTTPSSKPNAQSATP